MFIVPLLVVGFFKLLIWISESDQREKDRQNIDATLRNLRNVQQNYDREIKRIRNTKL